MNQRGQHFLGIKVGLAQFPPTQKYSNSEIQRDGKFILNDKVSRNNNRNTVVFNARPDRLDVRVNSIPRLSVRV
jgi:hypothetical protein